MRRTRIVEVLALVGLVATACSGGSADTATTTAPPSSMSSTTVVSAPTTTSLPLLSTSTSSSTTSTTSTTMPSVPSTTSSIPELPSGIENVVTVSWFNRYNFDVRGQVFENREVEGVFQTHVSLENVADDSQAPIYGLRLKFSTDLRVDSKGPIPSRVPDEVLTWDFGDVEEATEYVESPGAVIDFNSPVRFTPGMDASVSLDTITFSEPGTQTIALTIVARRDFSFWDFIFHLDPDNNSEGVMADVEAISLEPGDQVGPAGERIRVTPDRRDVAVDTLPPLVDGQTYTFEMTVSVDPKEPFTRYKPYVAIAWLAPSSSSPEIVRGDALSLPEVDELGTWDWTSAGMYTWEWQGPGLQYSMALNTGQP